MDNNNNIFWNEIMNQIKEDYYKAGNIDEYNIWFSGIKCLKIDGLILTISVPSVFFQNQIIKKGYLNIIQEKIYEKKHENFIIEIKLREEYTEINNM